MILIMIFLLWIIKNFYKQNKKYMILYNLKKIQKNNNQIKMLINKNLKEIQIIIKLVQKEV